jgi:hypothetical protein
MKLWETYLALGGSLDPEPDTQSPFFDPEEWRENTAHGRPGVRVLRRGGVYRNFRCGHVVEDAPGRSTLLRRVAK